VKVFDVGASLSDQFHGPSCIWYLSQSLGGEHIEGAGFRFFEDCLGAPEDYSKGVLPQWRSARPQDHIPPACAA
jgi:hypothetical protein